MLVCVFACVCVYINLICVLFAPQFQCHWRLVACGASGDPTITNQKNHHTFSLFSFDHANYSFFFLVIKQSINHLRYSPKLLL